MVATPANAINESTTGITGFTGTSFTGTPVTAHAVLVGGATSSTLTNVSVGASNSVLQGSTGADPSFTTTPRLVGLGIGAASTGSGLTFDGTNTLSNYATGTWTPTVKFGGGNTGITYAAQQGFYTRIGNVVYITCFLALSNKGSSTGTATIEGLPFSTGANGLDFIMPTVNANFLYSTFNGLIVQTNSNATNATLAVSTSGGVSVTLTDINFTNTSTVVFTGFYIIV